MKKFNYFWYSAPKTSQILYKIALGIAALCLIITLLGANKVINGYLFDLPVWEMFMSDEEFEDFEDEYVDVVEDIEDLNRSEKKEFEKQTGIEFDKFEKIFSKPSLKNLFKVAQIIDQSGLEDIPQEDIEIFKTILLVVIVYAAVLCLFILLFALAGSVGLAVFTLLLTVPFNLFLTGTGYLAATAILFIAYAVIQRKLNKQYKRYKKALKKG